MAIFRAYSNTTRQFPSFAKQVSNVTHAAARVTAQVVSGGPVFVPEEVAAQRWSICDPCEYRKDSRCTLCGCYLNNLTGKLKLATERCPANPPKWTIWVKTPES